MCEAGDRVNCPSNYTASKNVAVPTKPSGTEQVYDWVIYEEICWHDGRPLFTTLAPGPTELAPFEIETHLYNYPTGDY